MLLRAVLLFCTATLAGCVGAIPEFQGYRTAFELQFAESNKVFDRFAAAERRRLTMDRELEAEKRANEGGIAPFNPDHAASVLGVGDPPRVAGFRSAMASLKAYNDALSALATGEAAEALTARMGTIVSNFTATAAILGGASVEKKAGLAAVNETIGIVLPVFSRLKAASDRAAFRRELIAAYPVMRQLLGRMRAATPQLFEVLRDSYFDSDFILEGGLSAESRKKLEADRKLLSGWVIMLDQTVAALDAAVEATRLGSPGNVAALLEASVQLRATAEAIRAVQQD